jgi:hypothetical protein
MARHRAEYAMACNDLRRGRAKVGAIEARLERNQKRLLAFAHQVGAMRRAEITLTLAVGTGPGTRFEMISRIPAADCRSSVVCVAGEWQSREDGAPHSRHSELASVDHGHSLIILYVCWLIELRAPHATAMPTRGRVAGSYKMANRQPQHVKSQEALVGILAGWQRSAHVATCVHEEKEQAGAEWGIELRGRARADVPA